MNSSKAIVAYTRQAREDLHDIWAQIAAVNPVAADRIIDRITLRCVTLRDHGEIGPARPEIGEGARALIIDRWIAFYRIHGTKIEIVRIVDGRRDLTSLTFIS